MTTTTRQGTSVSFELQIATRAPGAVQSMRGREALSKLFAFDVVVNAERDDDVTAFVGQRASLVFDAAASRGSPARYVHGIVGSARLEGTVGRSPYRAWTVRLVPHLWLCRRHRTSRIFQDMSVPDIVREVLTAAGVKLESRLIATYVPRAYCVQYQETDYAFVRRILAEEGILWMFDHPRSPEGEESVVLLDAAGSYAALEPSTLKLRSWEGGEAPGGGDDDVLSFNRIQGIVSNAVLLRDYDFRKPLLDLNAAASSKDGAQGPDLSVYDHRGEYEQPALDSKRAETHLQQYMRREAVAEGTSTCLNLAAGTHFRLDVEVASELAAAYAAIDVQHELEPAAGGGAANYKNRFSCVPAKITYRPRRPKKRLVQVLESAVVVGPSGEEIYTDLYGRVKVRFHWDLGSSGNGQSSTWLRVMSPWAGQGYGAQFIPRVGTEVMVTFLGGDQDCPVVSGSVYNTTHPHPFPLPANKARSGFRTNSTPGGGGANELWFEDGAGEEKIHVHAQRDLETVVEHDESRTVRRNENVSVLGRAIHEVQGDRADRIGGGLELVVAGASNAQVAGSRTEAVAGVLALTAIGGRLVNVGGRDALEVASSRDETIGGDLTVRTAGNLTTVVGTADDPRSYLVRAEGTANVSASQMLTIASDAGISFQCGKNTMEISPDRIGISAETIQISTPKARIVVDGDTIRIKADATVQVICDQVLLKTDSTSLGLKSDVQVDGQKILLNSPSLAQDPVTDTSSPPTIIDLVDDDNNPIPNQRYLIVSSDGSQRSGFLDDKGHAEIDLDADANIVFPGLLDAASA